VPDQHHLPILIKDHRADAQGEAQAQAGEDQEQADRKAELQGKPKP
jgi:hypothetical protein